MWKDIEGYEGYKINENGVVLNKKGHMMRQALSNVGRPRVSLEVYDENGNLLHRDNKSIHRLVAQAFIENPNNLPLVMHKDNDPLHNHVSNLKWGTASENIQQAIEEHRRPKPILPKNTFLVSNGKETIRCKGAQGVAELVGFSSRSIRSGMTIQKGPYAGYTVTNTHEKIYSPFIQINTNNSLFRL